jgi:ferrous iron transport protein A
VQSSQSLAEATPQVPVILGAPQLSVGQTRRLAELGLRAGSRVTVLHRTAGGGRLVAVGQSRIALDRETLAGMPVSPA